MATRYYSKNDRDFMDRVNNELVGDLTSNQDGIINQTIVIYQHSIQETKTISNLRNIYFFKVLQVYH